ncbi:MAG: DNA polymerase III subunit gamma/tau [Acidobacteria bacterium]|nr:DNA polymerase III subunit gamma/tau [Acidobacteriota bacterium]
MSYQVIARKWRPRNFEEVTGQEHITRTLSNAIEHDRLHHAYLFSGARGVGKTTSARIFAKALNCRRTDGPTAIPCSADSGEICVSCLEISESRSIDVLEIDAASHTGIDDIRDTILENITVNPARDRYKIFIIDEVHQLSRQAFNALLKTLEEPPPNVVFIMATTEHHKVPETITSRCQEFIFRTIPQQKIFERLRLIADAEKIDIADEALREIARSGEGSMRDAQSNFDQVISFSGAKIGREDVVSALGIAGSDNLSAVIKAVAENDAAAILRVVDDLVSGGHDLRNFCRDLLGFVRDLSVLKVSGSEEFIDGSAFPADEMKQIAEAFSASDLFRIFHSLAETEVRLKEALQSRYVLELGLVRLSEMKRVTPVEELLKRLAELESSLGSSEPRAATANTSSPKAPIPEKKTLNSEPAARFAEPPPEEPPFYPEEPPFEPPFDPEPTPIEPVRERAEFAVPDDLPSKIPPRTAEELEHFEAPALDTAFEEAVLRSGESMVFLSVGPELKAQIVPAAVAAAHAGSSSAPYRNYVRDSERIIPDFARPPAEPEEDLTMPEPPPEDASPDVLLEYAGNRPDVRKVLKLFRAELVDVRRADK